TAFAQGSSAKLSPDGLLWLSHANAVSMEKRNKAALEVDRIMRDQYLAKHSIKSEKDPNLKYWMTTAAGLAMTGHIVAAQGLINEVADSGDYRETAFPVLRNLIENATIPPEDDESYVTANARYIELIS